MAVAVWSYLTKKGKTSPWSLSELLSSVLEVHPEDGLTLSTLGALAMQHGHTDAAIQHLTQALQSPVSEESAAAGLLDLYYQQANWTKSIEFAEHCIMLDPGHPGYHAIRADILKNLLRLKEGIKEAEESIRLDPTQLAVRAWLADAYEKDGQHLAAEDMRKTIRHMQTAGQSQ